MLEAGHFTPQRNRSKPPLAVFSMQGTNRVLLPRATFQQGIKPCSVQCSNINAECVKPPTTSHYRPFEIKAFLGEQLAQPHCPAPSCTETGCSQQYPSAQKKCRAAGKLPLSSTLLYSSTNQKALLLVTQLLLPEHGWLPLMGLHVRDRREGRI